MPDTNRALPNTTLHDGLSAAGFGAELIPLHSPLLGESHLVSFPALNDMLKFSAWSSTPEVVILLRSHWSQFYQGMRASVYAAQ